MTGLMARPRPLAGLALRLRRRLDASDQIPLVFLLVMVVAFATVGAIEPNSLPYTAMVLPMFIATLWLHPRTVPWLVIVCLLGVCVMLAAQPQATSRSVLRIAVTFAVALLIIVTSFRRSRLGVSAPRSESMFIDLRERIVKQGTLPVVPDAWQLEAEFRSAGGTAFAGDFIVTGKSADGNEIDIVVVDVSGKGVDAGSRALLLSGAFGGLLSAVPAEQFLPAASAYLIRQDWAEGFATAIHLHLDLTSGDFTVRKAGHPPALWLRAGSGQWQVLDSEGPVLGVIPGATFDAVSGRLASGDALLLYTDGLVESTDRDLHSGIDRLAGRGQRLMQRGFAGGASWIIGEIGRADDDQALVVVHRR